MAQSQSKKSSYNKYEKELKDRKYHQRVVRSKKEYDRKSFHETVYRNRKWEMSDV